MDSDQVEQISSINLTSSLTPPLPSHDIDASLISEHLSSVENDRSLQEIEIMSFQDHLDLLNLSSDNSQSGGVSSIVSLNALDRFIFTNEEGRDSARSVLEEILNNCQFTSDIMPPPEGEPELFTNINLDNRSLNSLNNLGCLKKDSAKYSQPSEDPLASRSNTIVLTSEPESFRDFLSSTSTGTTTTDYKQFQEDCHLKLIEYHNAIAFKDEQISKLSQAIEQLVANRDEVRQHFKNEMIRLRQQLEETSILFDEDGRMHEISQALDETSSKLERALSVNQMNLFGECRQAFTNQFGKEKQRLEEEIKSLKLARESDRAELSRLRQLLTNHECNTEAVLHLKRELDERHSKQMEKLRTYFEKKCADLEKNYSEEVFSQQSLKMSADSSSYSEAELNDFAFTQPGPGGDGLANPDEAADFERAKTATGRLEPCECSEERTFLTLEDLERRMDAMSVEHEKNIKDVEKHYSKVIEDLNVQLRSRVVTTTQQDANSDEFEIDEVVQSYERRLQEQVIMAKLDIIAALETQIQGLVASDDIDGNWPQELLQLKSRFTVNYEKKIDKLNREHADELARLKDEHARALERVRRRSLRETDNVDKDEWMKERNLLKKQTLASKHLLGELIKYFTQCEDELNNTLVEEIISKSCAHVAKELEDPDADFDSNTSKTRVRIIPNLDDLLNFINNSSDDDQMDSIHLRAELETCLEKLKTDANAVLALTANINGSEKQDQDKEFRSLSNKLLVEKQTKDELEKQLKDANRMIKTLEVDRDSLENQLELLLHRQRILEGDLAEAKAKISVLLENGIREVISEGYGEDGGGSAGGFAETEASLRTLQEKVRFLGENPSDSDPNITNLVEDLARLGDRIIEEARREQDDLGQQIEAAHKKYKLTRQFLEEQAVEREQERDDALKEINGLKELLKDREKDKANWERAKNEVEHMEQRLRDTSTSLHATEKQRKELENERKEAVDKILELRDIIRDLEDQLKKKTINEERLNGIVGELEALVEQQTKEDVDNMGSVSVIERFHQYVGSLESEIQRLRLDSELAGNEGVVRQIQNHLREIETTLDRSTKDLEGSHYSIPATTCSSPSEDMSIRDVVRLDECEVPLLQLARLKEKLTRHSRAEDAAIKRIRDLEMRIAALRSELDQSQAERDMLTRQISDHLVLISNLQIRLDEQRIRAEHIEKQTNTSLEVQNYDLKATIATLEDEIGKRDKAIAQLKCSVEETKKRLEDRDRGDVDLVVRMQEEVEFLRGENLKLKTRLKQVPDSSKFIDDDSSLHVNLEQERRAVDVSDNLPVSPIAKAHNKTVFQETEVVSLKGINEKHVRFEDQVRDEKLSSLEQIIYEKNKTIREYDERVCKLEEMINELRSDLKASKTNLRRDEDAIKTLQSEMDIQTSKLERSENELEECRNRLEATEKIVYEKETELKIAQDRLSDVTARNNELETHQYTITLQNEELKKLQEEEVDELRKHEANVARSLREQEARNMCLTKELQGMRKESTHLEHLLAEKERVIDQMTADSRSLHVNLETIQNKLRESGSVVDLSRRLCEEQKKNVDLHLELQAFKALEIRREQHFDTASDDYAALSRQTLKEKEAAQRKSDDYAALSRQTLKEKEAALRKIEALEREHEVLKRQLNKVQLDDALLIGQLRSKLDEALRNRHEFDAILKRERIDRTESEELSKIARQLSSVSEPRDPIGLTRVISKLEAENDEMRCEMQQLQNTTSQNLLDKCTQIEKLESMISTFSHNERLLNDELVNAKRRLEAKDNESTTEKKQMEEGRTIIRKMEEKPLESEQFVASIRELNSAMIDDAYLVDVVSRLNREKAVLEQRIIDLEERKAELPFGDAPSRANYLFAKYLRSESYRKQLAWQKQYLVSILGSYQIGDAPEPKKYARVASPIRFKQVAIMVVSVFRMKYLVRRWHSGKRIVTHKTKNNPKFQIGQPVSSQVFTSPINLEPKAKLNVPKTDLPWFGTSPPSREASASPKKLHPSDYRRTQEYTKASVNERERLAESLKSPGMLSKYVERFNEIQEKLGLNGS